jgi:hypothetical protein
VTERKANANEREGAGDGAWDAALRTWPEADSTSERSEREDAFVRSVTARIEGGEATTATMISDDELFASPLPRSSEDADERRSSTASGRARELDRQNLKDLAKMAHGLTGQSLAGSSSSTQRASEARNEDSGIVHLAAAAKADPGAEARAQKTPLASHDLFGEDGENGASGKAAEPPAPSSRSGANAGRDRKPNVVVALFVTGTIALASTAAAAIFFLKTQSTAPSQLAMAPAPSATAPQGAVAEAPAVHEPESVTPGADPNALPAASAPKLADLSKGRPAASVAALAPPVDGRLAKAERADKTAPPPATSTDLSLAMRKEIGDDTKDKTPAAALSGGGDVPQRPSQGAVTGALGGVLSEARRCLGPDDPISRAAIVFSSGGSVQSVSVTGPAAGKPTEACIKDALGKAKVQPFAEPSYTANITIRHL